ncbi:aminodeoxychorismate/anthranilate synthase component II [Ruminococcus sp. OA3]|uniref:anthranilate synthase component II n=1 Tax=Ruminococcus sp. OA3 TaxID=2914164 RepID=UPI001F056358|nr:aminodeoxychorismate/anthranilate synthase component II [Ruminococcus sp. OA3]MCH1982743.1 aminodeoxychorismate/anthranilate synthase component II [Ruminococcus sp. OA3]
MILLIDNYDSFTYNLYQYMGIFAPDIKVVRNDKITLQEIASMDPEKIVLSPGPKNPKEAGICMDVVREYTGKKPILGICLGHQCIGEALGGTVSYAKNLFHGKQSLITHDASSIFTGINSPIKVARYHSLAVLGENLPDCLKVLAAADDGEIMAMKHREHAVVGLQFHPESIYTEHGKRLIENFVNGVI